MSMVVGLRMRRDQMVEIKAGAELDRAVAEAIGWRIDPSRPLDWIGSNGVSVEEFRPSVDLNAAFDAAEKAGMFLELNRLSWGWQAGTHAMKANYAIGQTPALAICAAILALPK